MGFFDGIEDAKGSEGGVYIEPGVYALEIVALKAGKDRGGIPFFVAEFKTLESTNPNRPVGGTQAWMVKIKAKFRETFLGNIKTFLATLTGMEPAKVDAAGVDAAVSAANPFQGLKIRCSATNIETKETKSDYTLCKWSAY